MTASTPPIQPPGCSGTAIVLFGHGSRDPRWAEPMEAVATRLRTLVPHRPVVCTYLELMTPDLPTACDALVAQGARTVEILPMFLGTGRHAREDLPELVAALRQRHAGTAFVLRTALGEDPAMIEAISQWALRLPSDPA
ncbi:CbiX/SirB N-terminal domain-containing protein [Comamonadaceae bacterium PP-2]